MQQAAEAAQAAREAAAASERAAAAAAVAAGEGEDAGGGDGAAGAAVDVREAWRFCVGNAQFGAGCTVFRHVGCGLILEVRHMRRKCDDDHDDDLCC
jgi:hypothetical protein